MAGIVRAVQMNQRIFMLSADISLIRIAVCTCIARGALAFSTCNARKAGASIETLRTSVRGRAERIREFTTRAGIRSDAIAAVGIHTIGARASMLTDD